MTIEPGDSDVVQLSLHETNEKMTSFNSSNPSHSHCMGEREREKWGGPDCESKAEGRPARRGQ